MEQQWSVIHGVVTWLDTVQNLQVTIIKTMWEHGNHGHYVSVSGKKIRIQSYMCIAVITSISCDYSDYYDFPCKGIVRAQKLCQGTYHEYYTLRHNSLVSMYVTHRMKYLLMYTLPNIAKYYHGVTFTFFKRTLSEHQHQGIFFFFSHVITSKAGNKTQPFPYSQALSHMHIGTHKSSAR